MNILQKFVFSLKEVITHPVGRWATFAAMFRYIGIFACDYFGPAFYLRYYPSYSGAFMRTFPLLVMSCGFFSGLFGGILSDKFGKKSHMARTLICVIGNAIACPLFIMAMLLKDNFWLSLACIGARYALGETWKAPNLTII